jgi:thiosulfate/3-mercaptopyruvate sulfurtransferase
MTQHCSALIETQNLLARLSDSSLKILDASYHVPPSPRDAKAEYEQSHLPGAQFFDIDAIADASSSLPHMLPSPEVFEDHMNRLGIGPDDLVVVYDSLGMMSAPRAWWTFRYFGHERVLVLNGGLPKWIAENLPVQEGPVAFTRSLKPGFKARVNASLLTPLADVRLAASQPEQPGQPQIIDMRPAGRFQGKDSEPRPGLKRGHIPGSLNAPWASWLTEEKTLLSREGLQARCQQLGIDWQAPAIATCGSGITACVGALALYELGNPAVSVYDGAWAEWGSLEDTPVVSLVP